MAIVSSGQLTLTDLNDSKQLFLYLNGNYKTQIYDPNASSYTPNFTSSNLVVTPELYIAGGNGANLLPTTDVKSLTWYEGTQTTTALAETASGTTGAGYTYTIPTGAVGTTAKPLTIKSNITTNSQIYTCVIVYTDPDSGFDITLKATFEVVKITNGQKGDAGVNSLTAFLTNDNVSLAADNTGGSISYTNSGTEIHLYEGATELTYDGTGTANSTWKVTAAASGITAGTITDSGLFATVGVASNMTADNATITYTITGKTSLGTAINITKIQTFSKSKMGGTPTSYWMSVSSNVIQKNVSNVVTPASITITGYSQLGTAAPSSTAIFKFVTDTTTDGTTWTNNVGTPTGAVANTSYTTSNAVKGVRFRMYRSSDTPSTTNFIDEQTVWVVSDGATGIDSYYLNTWAPNGDTIRNSGGNILLQSDMYKGAGTVTPTAFKWYIQDGTATTASGGDTDGGNGWRLITSVAAAPGTAPTLAATTGGSLAAVAHYVKYTWCGLSGETTGSPEATVTPAANGAINVTIPAFPTNATMAKIYVGTATGVEYYAGDFTTAAGGTFKITKADSSAEAIPTANTATAVTSATITIRNWAIDGVEGFKCVATAPSTGSKYSGVIIVKDFQDPIAVNIQGSNIFKNGQGTVTLQAQLLQAGVQVATTGYTFAWSLYSANGSLIKTYTGVTGDTITVNATDVTGTANLVVDVSK